VEIEVRAGEVAEARLALADAGRLAIAVREVHAPAAPGDAGRPTPAKIQILDAASGAPVSPPLLSLAGEVDLPIAPGRYRVIASRGPELSIAEGAAEVQAGGPTTRTELAIARVVDTTGYLACDLHQHTARSADAGVSVEDRVASNVVEGVECAVASEHNLVSDLAPAARALGVEARFRSIAGEEISSDASRAPFGHVSVFPMRPDPAAPRGGALPVRDRLARDVLSDALALPGAPVIQINHPRSGANGYFDQLGFDAEAGRGAADGYDDRFDAVEVWSGRYVGGRARVLEDLWGLLRASRPVTPTANTDTHGVVQAEAGYPRTYVATGGDDPAGLDPAALVEAIRSKRDVVLTNGPFVTMRVGEARPGGLVAAREGQPLALSVRVERAPWVDATELRIWIGGVPGEAIPLTGARTTPAGALLDDVTIPLVIGRRARAAQAAKGSPAPIRIAEDTFVVAIVQGQRPLEPVLSGNADEILPFGMTSPIWIDTDGDGRALGR
ncbi:MAG: CehA/McbA family metallohydrolase, partial [Polyangiaceae bacterium]|nr:CehA/McbA family metallohydrolase [Polyangiaceae bacterium]